MTIKTRNELAVHPYHLVDPSPWPIVISFALFTLTMSSVCSFHGIRYANISLLLGFLAVLGAMAFWFRDIITEGTYQGHHTFAVQKGLNLGFVLFIISEIFFFISIFWAFFHSSLSPTVEIGASWPPQGIEIINPFELPLLNTILLLSSGAAVTYAHHSLINGNRNGVIFGLIFTIILAIIFSSIQGIEYWSSPFTITDAVYGSCFFFATGFHALHVMIGTIFIFVCLWRIWSYQTSDHHALGLESAILYWHFVDFVWIFVFIFLYWWGS